MLHIYLAPLTLHFFVSPLNCIVEVYYDMVVTDNNNNNKYNVWHLSRENHD